MQPVRLSGCLAAIAMLGVLLWTPRSASGQESSIEPAVQRNADSATGPAGSAAPAAGTAVWSDGLSCRRFVHEDLAQDARTAAVEEFLRSHSCPVQELAPEFVLAAELNDLDYRLLPVLAVLETGCGRQARNRNLFGWANGRKPFASFVQGIHFVAQRLRLAPHYAGKTLVQKLRIYNRRAWYRRKVLALMDKMPPEPSGPAQTAAAPSVSGGL